MKKSFQYYALAWLIVVILFNIIVFVTPNEAMGFNKFGGAFWPGYIFITLAFIGQLVCAYQTFKAENLKKVFYNLSLISISYTALVMMLIVGAACMVIPNIPVWIGILACMIVLGFSVISLIKAVVVIDAVKDIDEKIETQTQFIKMLIVDSEVLMNGVSNPELKAEAKKIYEAIRYSDPMSNPALTEVETRIQKEFLAFTEAVNAEDLEVAKCVREEVLTLIDSRNKKCKALK